MGASYGRGLRTADRALAFEGLFRFEESQIPYLLRFSVTISSAKEL
jgi:hypothetical protein